MLQLFYICVASVLCLGQGLGSATKGSATKFPLCTEGKVTPNDDWIQEVFQYKQIGDVTLKIHIYSPQGHQSTDRRPAIVFFFGGGWKGGSIEQFVPHCKYLASRGMVAAVAEYRVKSRHGTTPFECVRDGKTAIRWVRSNAVRLGIDPNRIAAGGGSAGGHVAAATGTVPGLEEVYSEREKGEDRTISCRPNAMVLFNPVFDNGPKGYGFAIVKERYKEISPMHNITVQTPPTIVFLGTKDALIPVASAKVFKQKMESQGNRCDLHLYEGQPHGFFNHRPNKKTGKPNDYYFKTVRAMDAFFESLGWIEGEPTIGPDSGK